MSKVISRRSNFNVSKKTNKISAFTAAECLNDEECKHITDCVEEYKLFLIRDFKKLRQLRICGVGDRIVGSNFYET